LHCDCECGSCPKERKGDCINQEFLNDTKIETSAAKGQLRFALAGNANVGKSVLFNQMTGLHQHIGNWPGKTVERAEGTLHFKGYTIDIIDLPGIYSLSTYSIEELVSREYIVDEKPDLVINVVDASILERNLFFTLQLIELETPLIIALNQMDLAKRKGIAIAIDKLEEILGVPVIPTVAVKGIGIYEILDKAIEVIENGKELKQKFISGKEEGAHQETSRGGHYCSISLEYGDEIETRIGNLASLLKKNKFRYPDRYMAIKLLEGDEEIIKESSKIDPNISTKAKELASEIENIHSHSCSTVITSERYEKAGWIARSVQEIKSPIKPLIEERLHNITTHKILGYPIMIIILLSMFLLVFTFGGWLNTLLTNLFYGLQSIFQGTFGVGTASVLVWSIIEGLIAGITIVLPYIIPFYIILYILENSGYLSRIAFLMDNLMHKIGLHGKAFIPMMLGYGCNVPACLGCRIMETERERTLAAFVTTLVPCAARTVVILGLVGTFVGIQWALGLYIFDLIVIFLLGRLAFKALPGESTALIMEMSDYKLPNIKTALKQTWFRVLEFIKIAFPIIIIGSFIINLIEVLGLMQPIAGFLSPVTVIWLGLPAVTGIALIFGVVRKELTLIMLAALLGTTNFLSVMTPLQMIVFTIVVLFYIPCIATIAALIKEFRWKKAMFITIFEILFAILLGGIALRLLSLFF
jgi:ferrous iron transport protein B